MGIDFTTPSPKHSINKNYYKNNFNSIRTSRVLTPENIKFLQSQGLEINNNERNIKRKQ